MCGNSYDRLISLAKRTGDRLIIHDPIEGHDVVIMDIDEYEMMVDQRGYGTQQHDCDFDQYSHDFERRDVRGMSEGELLDQINRDIAKWRADKEMDERWEREEIIEDEIEDDGPFDPFAEQDYHPAEWHSAGDVMEDRYKVAERFSNNDLEDENGEEFSSTKDSEDEWEIPAEFLVSSDKPDEIKIDDISDFDLNYEVVGEDSITGDLPIPEADKNEIPFKQEDNVVDWLEEPLEEEDEPVFYEEPI
mgnify:CR=1 FL=1